MTTEQLTLPLETSRIKEIVDMHHIFTKHRWSTNPISIRLEKNGEHPCIIMRLRCLRCGRERQEYFFPDGQYWFGSLVGFRNEWDCNQNGRRRQPLEPVESPVPPPGNMQVERVDGFVVFKSRNYSERQAVLDEVRLKIYDLENKLARRTGWARTLRRWLRGPSRFWHPFDIAGDLRDTEEEISRLKSELKSLRPLARKTQAELVSSIKVIDLKPGRPPYPSRKGI